MRVYVMIFQMICMILMNMNNQVHIHIQMIPLNFQSGMKRLSHLSVPTLEILSIQEEPEYNFKEKVWLFHMFIHCCMNIFL